MDWSTTTAMAMAIPERDMMLLGTPMAFMRMKVMKTARGREMQMISAPPKWPRMSRTMMLATMISSRTVPVTVSRASSTSRVLS